MAEENSSTPAPDGIEGLRRLTIEAIVRLAQSVEQRFAEFETQRFAEIQKRLVEIESRIAEVEYLLLDMRHQTQKKAPGRPKKIFSKGPPTGKDAMIIDLSVQLMILFHTNPAAKTRTNSEIAALLDWSKWRNGNLNDDTKRRRVGDAINLWGGANWLEKDLVGLSGSERRSRIIDDMAKLGGLSDEDIARLLWPSGPPQSRSSVR